MFKVYKIIEKNKKNKIYRNSNLYIEVFRKKVCKVYIVHIYNCNNIDSQLVSITDYKIYTTKHPIIATLIH